MERTFSHRVTILEWSAIALFALGTLYGFWHRQNVALVVLGTVFVLLTILALDRALHTSYVLTPDDVLIVRRGRFSRERRLALADIKTIRELPLAFRLGNFVLLELTNGRVESLQPENNKAFIAAIQKRL